MVPGKDTSRWTSRDRITSLASRRVPLISQSWDEGGGSRTRPRPRNGSAQIWLAVCTTEIKLLAREKIACQYKRSGLNEKVLVVHQWFNGIPMRASSIAPCDNTNGWAGGCTCEGLSRCKNFCGGARAFRCGACWYSVNASTQGKQDEEVGEEIVHYDLARVPWLIE